MSAEERCIHCGKTRSAHGLSSRLCLHGPGGTTFTPATPDAGDASEVERDEWCICSTEFRALAGEVHTRICSQQWADLTRLLAAREAAARAEEQERIAQAAKCGGCKGQGSHRRHCPRHPKYHPWIPLADRAESIGDSIGEPGLANRAWALAGAIRDEMPSHPYRPARIARGDS